MKVILIGFCCFIFLILGALLGYAARSKQTTTINLASNGTKTDSTVITLQIFSRDTITTSKYISYKQQNIIEVSKKD